MFLGFQDSTTRPQKIGAGNSALYNADGSIWKMVGKNPTFACAETCTLTAKSFVFKCGGVTWTLDGGGLRQTGGKVTHNGHDIGDTHQHKNTQPGAGLSGVPQ